MTIEIDGNVVEGRCSMTTWGLMDILPGKPFYVYVVNMMANPVNLPKFMKFMIVPFASSSPHESSIQEMKSHTC